MPLEIESQLHDRLVVGGVKHLLEDERPQDGVDLLGGSPEAFVERGGQFVDGQFREDLPAEKSGPGIFWKFASLGSHVVPFVEKRAGFAIPGEKHAFLR